MKIKQHLERIPRWVWPISAILLIFLVQRIFVSLGHPHSCPPRYWNLSYMRTLEDYEFWKGIGLSPWSWLWVDTLLYFTTTFISAFIGAGITSLSRLKSYKSGILSLIVAVIAVLPSVMIIVNVNPYNMPLCGSIVVLIYERYTIAEWTIISAIGGVLFFFLMKGLWIWRKKRNEK